MDKTDSFPEYYPDDDGDDVEILEVVGVEEGRESVVAPPAHAAFRTSQARGNEPDPSEYLLDFDDPGVLIGAAGAAEPTAAEDEEERQRLLRLRADYDNLRKRIDRERDEFERYANLALVSRLLPVLDNLERALAVVASAGAEGPLREGLVMIHRQLTEQLRKEGLQAIESVGRTFDPNLHDAVATESSFVDPANMVVEEFQKGYLFYDRVLRPAMVKVSTGAGEPAGDR